MTSSSSALVDLTSAGEELNFTTTHTFNTRPVSAKDDDDRDDDTADDRAGLLGAGAASGSAPGTRYNFWSMSFYQQFFDVDTSDVSRRIACAIVPRPRVSFLRDVVSSKPDLYGPFWICATLVVCVAVWGNLASYWQAAVEAAAKGETEHFAWHYDFHKVTLAASAVFSYALLVPSGIYGFLWWTSSVGSLGFLDLICLYGYSLAVYVPISALWMIPNAALQWILVAVGAGLSGAVLVLALWGPIRESAPKFSVILVGIAIALHILLACGFMLYFFHYPGVNAVQKHDGDGAVPSGPLQQPLNFEPPKAEGAHDARAADAADAAPKDKRTAPENLPEAVQLGDGKGKGESKVPTDQLVRAPDQDNKRIGESSKSKAAEEKKPTPAEGH